MFSLRKNISVLPLYFLPLLSAAFLYFFFREPSTVFHNLIAETTGVLKSDFLTRTKCISLPNWIIYNLPGALWLFSFALISIKLFGKTKKQSLLIVFCMTTVMLLIEVLQGFGFTDGTFDLLDVAAYVIGALAAFGISSKLKLQVKAFKLSWKQKRYSFISIAAIFIALIYLSDVH